MYAGYKSDYRQKPGINVISPNFMQQWNSALKNTERRLVELLRDETKKIVSSLYVEFETSLKEAYPRNLKGTRERVIKENVHLVESLRIRRNKKWRKFEGRVGASREKLKGNSDRLKLVNSSDRQRRKRNMLINETKSEVSAQAETQMVSSQRDAFLNSSSNVMNTLSLGKKMDNESNGMVDRTEAAGKPIDFNIVVEEVNSVSNVIDDTILNRDERSLNEPTTIGKNDISKGKENSNISQVFARVSYANIVKQPNRLTRPSNIPAYISLRVSPPKIQRGSIVNDLTQGDESLLETLESLCDNNKDHSEEGRMKWSFVSDYVFNLSKKVFSQTEINVLEKGLGFSPTPSFFKEADLRSDFNELSRKMRCKWYFRNGTQGSKEIHTFQSKSTWNPPKGSPALELFLNKTEQNLFQFC